MKDNVNKILDSVVDVIVQSTENVNISTSERIVSVATGGFILWKGMKDIFSKPSNSVWEVALGGALLYRGVTGYCKVKDKLLPKKEETTTTYLIEAM
ncbi:YgaP family membrane protein [Albibacterium bauzanense]|uniref:DUF2892 family protein n=1 Tax=Albibacterium bauzanense TaxID=653929 RepID=A0A4R1M1U9_9SPHI|nr:DUF2892 domain-containing protein [Albibacterium bauzanense]TCK85172.1 Protein of unknown function (DUF2892) [Albibacterium bauzanense]